MKCQCSVGAKRGAGWFQRKTNQSEDGGDGGETEPEEGNVRIEVCGGGSWVGGVAVVTGGCPSEADEAEGAVDIALWRHDVEELNKGEFLENIVWEGGGIFWEAEEGVGSGDPNNGAGV